MQRLSIDRRTRLWVAATAMTLAHAAVLSALGFSVSRLAVAPASQPPQLLLFISKTYGVAVKRKRAETNGPVPSVSLATGARAALPAPPLAASPTSAAEAKPSPSPAAAREGPDRSLLGTSADAGVEGGAVAGAVRAALRASVGCDFAKLAQLTAEERNRCAQRTGETARRGPNFIDPIPPEKRTYYDAVQAAYQASRDPVAHAYVDANGNIRSWGGPPAIGCTLKPHFRPGTSFTDKIKATGMIAAPIGPLSCGLLLPQGTFTPELGIPTP